MIRRLPPLGALRTFEAAARHVGFTRAADELGVTPAAVSAQIRGLEEQLGVRLFWRTSREMQLTAAGETLHAAVAEALDTVARAVERIGSTGGGHKLKISVGFSFAAKWLVPRLNRFRDLHPEADVQVDISEGLADFRRDEVDVAIRFGTGSYPGLRADRLFDEEVFPICSPRLLDGAWPLRTPDDLRHHTLIHQGWQAADESWPDWRMWLKAAGVEGVDVGRGIRFDTFAFIIQATLEGQGVALGNTSLVGDDLAAGRLVRPFALSLRVPHFAYYLVCPRSAAEPPLVGAFRAWMLAQVEPAATDEKGASLR